MRRRGPDWNDVRHWGGPGWEAAHEQALDGAAFKAARASRIRLARGRCEGCGRRDAELHGHHADYARLGRERRDDMRAVCSACHGRIHGLERAGRTLADATALVCRRTSSWWAIARPSLILLAVLALVLLAGTLL